MEPTYELEGSDLCPQVDPDASYWLDCTVRRTPRLDEILDVIHGNLGPYPAEDSREAQGELDELERLRDHAHEDLEGLLARNVIAHPENPGGNPLTGPYLSMFLTEAPFTSFPPHGAVLPVEPVASGPLDFSRRRPVTTGAELASLFESEIPGLWQRHVFNVLQAPQGDSIQRGFCQSVSPPRLALAWAALDMAIMAALSAAWHTKWLAVDGTRYRPRPYEAGARRSAGPWPITFDYKVRWEERTGAIPRMNEPPRNYEKDDSRLPRPSPGSPRHPALPSGHSTYSGAASRVMECLFPHDADGNLLKDEYDKLAHNIGEARLWGGVHWRSDHAAGIRLGRAIGDLVLNQLRRSGVVPIAPKQVAVPDVDDLRKQASAYEAHCGRRNNPWCGGIVPPEPTSARPFDAEMTGEHARLYALSRSAAGD